MAAIRSAFVGLALPVGGADRHPQTSPAQLCQGCEHSTVEDPWIASTGGWNRMTACASAEGSKESSAVQTPSAPAVFAAVLGGRRLHRQSRHSRAPGEGQQICAEPESRLALRQ